MTEGSRLSDRVIGCAQNVSRELGAGFFEKVYENALCVEFRRAGIPFRRQQRYSITYKKEYIGYYVADLVIDNRLLLELKALPGFSKEHDAQVMNYLRASGLSVGLLLNFGVAKLGIRRVVWGYNDDDNI